MSDHIGVRWLLMCLFGICLSGVFVILINCPAVPLHCSPGEMLLETSVTSATHAHSSALSPLSSKSYTLFSSLILCHPSLAPFRATQSFEDVLLWAFWCQEKACDGFSFSQAISPWIYLATNFSSIEDIFTRLVSEWASLVARHGCSLLWSSSSQGFQDHTLPRTQRWLWRQESAVVDRTFLRATVISACASPFPIHDLLQPRYLGPIAGCEHQGLRGQDLTYSLSDLAVLLPAFGCLN